MKKILFISIGSLLFGSCEPTPNSTEESEKVVYSSDTKTDIDTTTEKNVFQIKSNWEKRIETEKLVIYISSMKINDMDYVMFKESGGGGSQVVNLTLDSAQLAYYTKNIKQK